MCQGYLCQNGNLAVASRCVTRIGESTFMYRICMFLSCSQGPETQLFSFNFYFFIFDCTRFLLLCVGFLWLLRSGAILYLLCSGFPLQWLPLLQSMSFMVRGFLQLWLTGSATPQHMESSWIRDWTRVPWTPAIEHVSTTGPPGKPKRTQLLVHLILRYISRNDLIILPCDFNCTLPVGSSGSRVRC